MPVKVQLQNVGMAFTTPGGTFRAVAPLNLSIPSGRFISLVGPSGCGKSTLFNIVAGLLQPTEGRVLIDGEDATGSIGRVGYMLQKDLLLPWRTVLDNVILGMEIQGRPLRDARDRALPLLQKYGLTGFEYLYPNSLSGGMRQRAALLRTLLFDTDVILLDEPFGALDAQTKLQMQEWLMQLWSDFQKTVVFVTHDVEEAIYLSDDIHVMGTRPGRILKTIPVMLPRPRVRTSTLTPEFIAIKERCLSLLRLRSKRPWHSHSGHAAHCRNGKSQTAQSARRKPRQSHSPSAGPEGLADLGDRCPNLEFWLAPSPHGELPPPPACDAFFWSKPAQSRTLLIYFTEGSAWTDISYTFRSTILGFIIGTTAGSLLGLSFWWSRNYAESRNPTSSASVDAKLRWRRSCAGIRAQAYLEGRDRDRSDHRSVDIDHHAGVKALVGRRKLFYSLGASRWQVFRKLVCRSAPRIINCCASTSVWRDQAVVGEFISSQHGLGRTIFYASSTYEIALVWVAVFTLSALAVIMWQCRGSALRKARVNNQTGGYMNRRKFLGTTAAAGAALVARPHVARAASTSCWSRSRCIRRLPAVYRVARTFHRSGYQRKDRHDRDRRQSHQRGALRPSFRIHQRARAQRTPTKARSARRRALRRPRQRLLLRCQGPGAARPRLHLLRQGRPSRPVASVAPNSITLTC